MRRVTGSRMRRLVLVGFTALATLRASAADLPNLPSAIEKIKPAIVAIGTSEPTRNPAYQFLGTGFVVGDGTLIGTNSHVAPVTLDGNRLESVTVAIPLPSGEATMRTATVVARDPEHDVALLKLEGAPLTPVRFGDASQVREGQTFAFTGFPLGGLIGLFPTTHHALVSAITPVALAQANSRSLDAALVRRLRSDRFQIFQLDATAYPGNSGSPLFNVDTGEVVAVINMTFVKGGKEAAITNPSGISYAIPIVYLSKLLATVSR